MPDATATALLARCHHPLVRDLAWLLLAPDLVDSGWPARPSRRELGLDDGDRLVAFLDDLEAAPETLEQRVGDTVNGRMGLYHERLWQYLLDRAPGTCLLAHNLRVHRGKLTLGELDLLYRRRDTPSLIHLEVAIKFYLGLPEGPGDVDDPSRWIGPGGADSLACKLAHLRRHQLTLTDQAETREAIRLALTQRLGRLDATRPIDRRLAMPGVLFQPWRQPLPDPRGSSPRHARGRWVHWEEWRDLRDGLPRTTRAAWLAKPHWLAPPRERAFTRLRDLEARQAQHFAGPATPVQVALATGGVTERLFVVGNAWPLQVPLPPAP